MNQVEFEALLANATKRIDGDIRWSFDPDHSPACEFRVEVDSDSGHPIFINGSFNPLTRSLSYTLIHRGHGRIYALDLGKDHHNPDCNFVGEKHKHKWTERLRDKEAYVPEDITETVDNPVAVWGQFCREANVTHNGVMHQPPAMQIDLL